jgi:hypothetical protein
LLEQADPLDWGGFRGRRMMLEFDACQDVFDIAGPRRIGTWPGVIRRHGFDEVITSGRAVARNFEALGIRAWWVPKGFDATRFRDAGEARRGICHFGTAYPARQALDRYLRRRQVTVEDFTVPYDELPARLNRYLACLVCNMAVARRWGKVGAVARRVVPGTLVTPLLGPEPMIKNFEAAASGCAVFADESPDLAPLGFVDGVNVITYTTFDELLDKIHSYGDEELRAIGVRSAEFCLAHHTWRHRAAQIMDIVGQPV